MDALRRKTASNKDKQIMNPFTGSVLEEKKDNRLAILFILI